MWNRSASVMNPKLQTRGGVVDREELFAAMAHGVLVISPLRGADIAPIALYVTVDETLRIFLGFDERHERAGGHDHPADHEPGWDDLHRIPPFSLIGCR